MLIQIGNREKGNSEKRTNKATERNATERKEPIWRRRLQNKMEELGKDVS